MKYRFALLAASVFVSLFIINNIYPQPYGRGDDNWRDRDRMDLNLTDAQEDQIEGLRLQHREVMIKLRSELELKQLEVKKLYNNENFSRNDYLAAVKDVTAVKNKIAEARANHRMDVYELLDDNQKKEYLSRGERRFRGDGFGRGPCGGFFRERRFRDR